MIEFSLMEMPEQAGVRVGEDAAAGLRFGHGCVPDQPDSRDYPYPFEDDPKDHAAAAKTHVDLSTSKEMPEVWDQLPNVQSCVAHAVAAAWVYAARRSGHEVVTPSRLFIWYEARLREGVTATDHHGVQIRSALWALWKKGAPPEEEFWRYDVTKLADQPPPEAYAEAKHHKATNYFVVNKHQKPIKLEQLKGLLAVGLPICFSFSYFRTFDSPDEVGRTGKVLMPTAAEYAEGSPGLHAALLVGYDDKTHLFKVRNSFGPTWGQQGHFTIPYDYVCKSSLVSEFWTLHYAH